MVVSRVPFNRGTNRYRSGQAMVGLVGVMAFDQCLSLVERDVYWHDWWRHLWLDDYAMEMSVTWLRYPSDLIRSAKLDENKYDTSKSN